MKQLNLLACVLLLSGLFWSCTDDSITSGSYPDGGGDGTFPDNISITVKVPAAPTVSTYSMSELQECEIESVDILVFNNVVGSDFGKFLYHEAGVDVEEVAGYDTRRKFSMKIRQTQDPNNVKLMILANVSGVVEKLIEEDEIKEGDTMDEIISKLVYQLPIDETTANEGGKWLVKPGRYTRFPMWGVSTQVDLTQPTITVPIVSLLRACAKIDIGLNFVGDIAQGLDNFYLEEYHLYNAYSSLMIAPASSNYDNIGKKVTDYSLPAGVTTFNPNRAISYYRRAYREQTEGEGSSYKDFLSEIYLAEHPEGSQEYRDDNVAIVIGGRYGTKDADITYYRIDLVKHDNGGNPAEWLPVLRNHRYRINITKVLNRGYDTKEDAFAAMGLNTNLEIDIVDEDENITENVYDGQYRLGVNKTSFTIDKGGVIFPSSPRQVYVSTNLGIGWKASADVSWIKFVQDDGVSTGTSVTGPSGVSYLNFLVDEHNGSDVRDGVITLQAGRLFIKIDITQTAITAFETSGVSDLYPMDGSSQTFQIKSTFDWAARVVIDDYNVITSFDKTGGESFGSYVDYTFTTLNDILMDALHEDDKLQEVTFEFYSPTDEFEAYRQAVNIRSFYTFKNVLNNKDILLYPVDQPMGSQWYIYANAEANNSYGSNNDALQGTVGQEVPPHINSCAALGEGWNLPTRTEVTALFNGGFITVENHTNYGLFHHGLYWTGTSYSAANAYIWLMSGGTMNASKTNPGERVRCVRVR